MAKSIHIYMHGTAQKTRDRKTRDCGCANKRVVSDSVRLIQTYSDGTNQVKVYYDSDLSEYVARLFKGGKLYEPADYFTDDKSDALSTAQDMLRRQK